NFRNVSEKSSDDRGRRCAGAIRGERNRNVKAVNGGIDQPGLVKGTSDRGRGGRIERRVKGQQTERAEAVVGDDLGLRVELAGRIALMEMGDCEELGGENEGGRDERNRLCAAANQPPNTHPPGNHRSTNSIGAALIRYPP